MEGIAQALKLFSFRREAPSWMPWRTLVMAEVHSLWILVNRHHHYHSVCVCVTVLSVYQRESGYLHMAESKYLVKMRNVIDG